MIRKRFNSEFGSKITIIFTIILLVCSIEVKGDNEDLRKQANRIFGILPKEMVSSKNPITPEKVALGKILFYETRISVDGTVSCARCHPFSLYAADGLKKAIGNQNRVNLRNSPTILNAAGQISAHWVGDRTDVESQAKQSVIGKGSFGMPSYDLVIEKLKSINGYAPLFKRAFPNDNDPINMDNFAMAVGAFERTLVTPAPFDEFLTGKVNAMPEQEKNGLKTFIEIGCAGCHSGSYMGGQMYSKFGIFETYWSYTKSDSIDTGRFSVTGNEADKYVFKVPILRNITKTSPYFHDGSVETLEQAEMIMGKTQLGKDLTKAELGNIYMFLVSLTGKVPEQALKVPFLPSIE
jgi:cytochrome c peroxidase